MSAGGGVVRRSSVEAAEATEVRMEVGREEVLSRAASAETWSRRIPISTLDSAGLAVSGRLGKWADMTHL